MMVGMSYVIPMTTNAPSAMGRRDWMIMNLIISKGLGEVKHQAEGSWMSGTRHKLACTAGVVVLALLLPPVWVLVSCVVVQRPHLAHHLNLRRSIVLAEGSPGPGGLKRQLLPSPPLDLRPLPFALERLALGVPRGPPRFPPLNLCHLGHSRAQCPSSPQLLQLPGLGDVT